MPAKVTIDVEPKSFGIKCNGQDITSVTANSQAEKAGVKKGWKILSIAGKAVKTTADVTRGLADNKKKGKKYKIICEDPKGKEVKEGKAESTKELTADGAKVTTVAEGAVATAAAPAEPVAAAAAGGDEEVAKKKAEEEAAAAAKKKAEEEAAAAAAAAAEAARIAEEERKANGNGEVKLVYENYQEMFKITDGGLGPDDEGRTGSAYLDEEYCLSFVMPNCMIHLCTAEKKVITTMADGEEKDKLYVKEEPAGTFHGLQKDQTYYVMIVEDTEEARKDAERMASVWANMDTGAAGSGGMGTDDCCTCKMGLPCVDQPVCNFWETRFTVAEANGWNPTPAEREAFMKGPPR